MIKLEKETKELFENWINHYFEGVVDLKTSLNNDYLSLQTHDMFQAFKAGMDYKNKKSEYCKIYGTEIEFNRLVPLEKIAELAKKIWENPQNYSKYENNSEDAYYEFLKYLWIKFPGDMKDIKLTDFILKDKII